MSALTTLQFDNTTLDIIDRNGQQWIMGNQIALALGYKQSRAVTKIFNRNADEFTEEMTQVVNLPPRDGLVPNLDKRNPKDDVRIFSPRGAHLIAMFARTDKAKAFRKWVLDVLDSVLPNAEPQTDQVIERISPEQKGALQQIMSARCAQVPSDMQGKVRATLWKMIHALTGVASYSDIPASMFLQARDALMTVQPVQLNTYEQPKLESEVKAFHYPEETAKPSNEVSKQALLNYRVLSDERYTNPLSELLKEVTEAGYNINGAVIVYKAMLHNLETQHNTLRNISDRAGKGANAGYKYYMNKQA